MKIYKKKHQPGYFILSNIKIRSFDYIWNPHQETKITKEHLKLYIEKIFFYNFLFFKAPWFGGYVDQKCFTSSSRVLSIYCNAFTDYCLEIDETFCYKNKTFYPYFIFLFDSSEIYKKFSHLITGEDFSILLQEHFVKLLMFPDSYEDNLFNFFFFSKEEQKKELLGEEYKITDEKKWEQFLKEAATNLERFCDLKKPSLNFDFEKDTKEPMFCPLEKEI